MELDAGEFVGVVVLFGLPYLVLALGEILMRFRS
jgi:hypothetical protein